MKKEPFTTSADSTALPAGGAPAWAGGSHRCSGKSAVLARSPDRHERGSDERRRLGMDPVGQQDDVEGAVGAVEQRGADQIEDRAEQREQQIAQRGL